MGVSGGMNPQVLRHIFKGFALLKFNEVKDPKNTHLCSGDVMLTLCVFVTVYVREEGVRDALLLLLLLLCPLMAFSGIPRIFSVPFWDKG